MSVSTIVRPPSTQPQGGQSRLARVRTALLERLGDSGQSGRGVMFDKTYCHWDNNHCSCNVSAAEK